MNNAPQDGSESDVLDSIALVAFDEFFIHGSMYEIKESFANSLYPNSVFGRVRDVHVNDMEPILLTDRETGNRERLVPSQKPSVGTLDRFDSVVVCPISCAYEVVLD